MKSKYALLVTFALITLSFSSVYAQEESTTSSDLKESFSKPIAYIGSITDITESTLNLSRFTFENNVSGEILQIMAEEDTTDFVDSDDNQEIEFEDIAIGDFIIAMGTEEREGVLDAKRIVITETPETIQRNTYFANLIELGDEEITIKSIIDNENISATYDERTIDVYTKNSDNEIVEVDLIDIEEGQDLIVFTTINEDETEVTSIFVVQNVNPTSSPDSIQE